MITILEARTEPNVITGITTRGVTIHITDGTTAYVMQVGQLALTGDLQTILNGMEADLWGLVQINGVLATAKENAKVDLLIYLVANPNANLLFTTTAADLKLQIDTLIDVLFAGHTAGNRNKTKWLWNTVALVARESVAGE